MTASMTAFLSDDERVLCANRPNAIHIDPDLFYLGNYERRIPVNLTRMMENAYDWAHLPFVHQSSFANIELIDEGKWGWRAKLDLANEGGTQLIDLLVDVDKHYWATTVFSGTGTGIQIHTQATKIDNKTGTDEINVDVRFYLPEAPDDQMTIDMLRDYMVGQYRQLYDEDQELMQGRQDALDAKKTKPRDMLINEILVGNISDFDPYTPHIIDTPKGKYTLRYHQDKWQAYAATCPHLLGPLQDSVITDNKIMCPWHGYHFDIATGENIEGHCKALKTAKTTITDGQLMLIL